MASPQLENGYTSIANELYEAWAKIRIPGEARQVLDVIIRKTYGFHKKEDQISLSQFCLATGLKKPTVCKAIKKLVVINLITKKGNKTGEIYSLNKDFNTWKPLPKKVTLPKKVITVTQKANKSLPKKVHTKDIYTKETITKEITHGARITIEESPEENNEHQQVVEIIDLFKPVNPAYGRWYANTNQREAIKRMIEIHGMAMIKQVIEILPKSNEIPYIPTITTPCQLETKWADLKAALIKEKAKLKNYQHNQTRPAI